MKKLISILLFAVMLLALTACNSTPSASSESSSEPISSAPSSEASSEAPEESSEISEESSEISEESSEIEEEPTPTPAQTTEGSGSYSLHASQSNDWSAWNEDDFASVIITPTAGQYIIEDIEKYPAKFIKFDKPADTALYELSYDTVIYIDRSKNLIYTYTAYKSASFELFLEDVDEADIIDTGSENSTIYWNADRESVNVMLDVKDIFENSAKLTFSIYDQAKEISKDDLIALATSELARIESTMEVLEPGQYWSAGEFSTVDLNDSSAEVGVTIDVSGFTPYKLEQKAIDMYGEYNVVIDLNYYIRDDAVESTSPAGNTIFVYETEYSVYAFYDVGTSKRDETYYLEIQVDTVGDPAYALIDDIIARTTLAQ